MTTALAHSDASNAPTLPCRQTNDLRRLLNPAWRHSRATSLIAGDVRHLRRGEDVDVRQLVSFLRVYRGPGPDAHEDAMDQFPYVFWAFHIYTDDERGPKPFLEAMVLAGADQETIAEYLGLPVEVEALYERLFFDLRGLQHQHEAIRTYVVARTRKRGLADLDPDVLWKLIGLSEGVEALYALWSAGQLAPNDKRRLDEIIASNMRRNALDAQFVRKPTHYNATDIVNEYLGLRRIELDEARAAVSDGSGAGGANTSDLVAALLHAIQFTTAPIGREADAAYVEVSSAVEQAPAILARLQGTTRRNQDHVQHRNTEQRTERVDDDGSRSSGG